MLHGQKLDCLGSPIFFFFKVIKSWWLKPTLWNAHCFTKVDIYQVHSDSSSDDETHVDVDRVTAILSDLCQARQSGSYGEDEDQHRLQELGAVWDGGIKVHLLKNRKRNLKSVSWQSV